MNIGKNRTTRASGMTVIAVMPVRVYRLSELGVGYSRTIHSKKIYGLVGRVTLCNNMRMGADYLFRVICLWQCDHCGCKCPVHVLFRFVPTKGQPGIRTAKLDVSKFRGHSSEERGGA
jgi:hypothetical protein